MNQSAAILFDCDGTLIDSVDQTLQSFQYAIFMTTNKMLEKTYIKKFFGPSGDVILKKLIVDPVLAENAFEIYLQHQQEAATSINMFPGIRPVIEQLAQWGIPMGLVTGRHTFDLDIVMKPHQINQYFSSIITDNTLNESKPDPEGIRKALRQMGNNFQTVYYVGDSLTDVQAAHAAGCKAIAALWDNKSDFYQDAKKYEKENTEFYFNLPEDLLRLFE